MGGRCRLNFRRIALNAFLFCAGSWTPASRLVGQTPSRAPHPRNLFQSAVALVPISQLSSAISTEGSLTFCSRDCYDGGPGFTVLRLLPAGRVEAAECDLGCGSVIGTYVVDSPVSFILHVNVPPLEEIFTPYQRIVLQRYNGHWILCPWMIYGAERTHKSRSTPCGTRHMLFPMHRVSRTQAAQLGAAMSRRWSWDGRRAPARPLHHFSWSSQAPSAERPPPTPPSPHPCPQT